MTSAWCNKPKEHFVPPGKVATQKSLFHKPGMKYWQQVFEFPSLNVDKENLNCVSLFPFYEMKWWMTLWTCTRSLKSLQQKFAPQLLSSPFNHPLAWRTDADRSYLWVRSPISLLRWPRELSGVCLPSTGLSCQHLGRLQHQHCFCLLPSIFICSLHGR